MRFDYGSFNRGLSYEETHFAETFKEWGYEVIHFDFVELARRFGKSRMNEMLRECALRTNPDLAFFVLFRDEVEPESIEFLRRHDVITVNWFCDDQWRYEGYSRYWAPYFDFVTTTSEDALLRYMTDGHTNVIKTQWGFNPYIFRARKPLAETKSRDVVFVGQPHGNRKEIVDLLRRRGLAVDAYGYGWPSGRIIYSDMIELYSKSRIVLGLSNGSARDVPQIKGRDFEVPGAGACHITAHHPELSRYFAIGREIVCYSDVEELASVCRDLLHTGLYDEIAQAGRDRAWQEHTYVHRFSEIFDHCHFRKLDSREHVCA